MNIQHTLSTTYRRSLGEVLSTLFLEAKYIVNLRPFTFISSDEGDLETLTPMHFLVGIVNTPKNLTAADMFRKKQWKVV